jgi:chorismate-pyruvate lyase
MSFIRALRNIEFGSLDILLRMLLACDGTLVDALEAAFHESIKIVKLGNTTSRISAPVADLRLEIGQYLLCRKVIIVGEQTGRKYVFAETMLALERVPPAFQRELYESDKPIGKIWFDHGLEGRKELLSIEKLPSVSIEQILQSHQGIITRRYRLTSGGAPIMVIAESFPARLSLESD